MINAGPGQFSPDMEDANADADAWHSSHSEMVGDRMSGRAARLAGVVHWCGALASVGLLIGFAVWGVKLSLRDVTQVPVVLALEKPMRVAPSNPGGADIAHKGLSVNEVQEARGTPEAPMEVRVLDEPTQLHSEDMTVAAEVVPLTEEERAAQTLALVERLVSGASRLSDPLPEIETVSRNPVEEELAVLPAPAVATPAVEGLGRSLYPMARPASFGASAPRATVVQTSLSQQAPPAPGDRLVQLGAFDSPEMAQKAWDGMISGPFAPLMDGKRKVIMEAQSGGRMFYRLRAAGFVDLSDARRFCAELLAGKADCIPVVAR